jgi:hypothetical protein
LEAEREYFDCNLQIGDLNAENEQQYLDCVCEL